MLMLLSLAVFIVSLASWWVLFEKAGKPGWAAIVPIYNLVIVLQIIRYPLWSLLFFFIPIANFFMYMFALYNVGKKFGQTDGFCWGLALLSPVFLPLLAFRRGPIQYHPEAQGI